jgi:hypothetical protein
MLAFRTVTLYSGVSVPNSPIVGDLRVDKVQICDNRVLSTANIVCIELLNITHVLI